MRELVIATVGAIILIAWGVAAANGSNSQWAQRSDGAERQTDLISSVGVSAVDANGGALNRDTIRAR